MAWPFNDTVQQVVRSLRDEPESWRYLRWGAEIQHTSGLTVWVANKRYGLDIREGSFGVPLWGGVTMLSSIGLSLNHHVLGNAVDRWKRQHFGELLSTEGR